MDYQIVSEQSYQIKTEYKICDIFIIMGYYWRLKNEFTMGNFLS